MLLLQLLLLPPPFASSSSDIVWTGGDHGVKVTVASNGSYSVSVGGSMWLGGSANSSVGSLAAPFALRGVRTVQGTQARLGAFTGAEISLSSSAPARATVSAHRDCGPLEHDVDYHGNDLRFVANITDPAVCCALCVADKACAGFSLMGAADKKTPWARRCYLKSSMVKGEKFKTHVSAKVPGRTPAPAPPSPSPGPGPPSGPPAPPLPAGTTIALLFTIKYFAAVDLFLFEQLWPDGLELQYTTRRGLLAAFPNFDATTAVAAGLSGVTWSGEMSGGDVCHAAGGDNQRGSASCITMGGSKAASGFGEGADGPLVLLQPTTTSNSGNGDETIVFSAFDKFGHQRSQASGGKVGWGFDLSVAPAAKTLPKAYNSSLALHGGKGGVNMIMRSWGRIMQTGHGTVRKTGTVEDALTYRVGYWTDNVAYYGPKESYCIRAQTLVLHAPRSIMH